MTSAVASSGAPETIAEFTGLPPERFWNLGAFNMPLTRDASFYIDPRLLEQSDVPELQGAADQVYENFTPLIAALAHAKIGDEVWKGVLRQLKFREVPGMALGFSETSGDGRGIGPKLAKGMAEMIHVFARKGVVNPAVLGVLTVTQPGFGGDRISDVIIAVTHERFVAYSHRIYQALGVPGQEHPLFQKYRLPRSPYSKQPILLVPYKILRNLHGDELGYNDLFGDNEELRAYFDKQVRSVMGKRTRVTSHDYFRAFTGHPKKLQEVAQSFRAAKPKSYDFSKDPQDVLVVDRAIDHAAKKRRTERIANPKDFEAEVVRICREFQHYVEQERFLYRLRAGRIPEKEVQKAFHVLARSMGQTVDIDVSPETNPGPGAMDFKFSLGASMRSVVEMKLADHDRLQHGYEQQLQRYVAAERADHSVYLVVQQDDRKKERELFLRCENLKWPVANRRPKSSGSMRVLGLQQASTQ